jgi:SSS family solute:Na+ symporter
MSQIDWLILVGSLAFIVIYGSLKSRGKKDMDGFLKGDNQAKWWTVGLSVMATQASAITFMSTPGQAYHDGMGFVQTYFGLPIAMVIICIVFIPIYHNLKVFTAYEYLEQRFDLKTRVVTAILFLIQRGMGAGLTIFAPSIILSTILGWDLTTLNIILGGLVIIYTMSGGTQAVNVTQKQQMAVIFLGLFVAFYVILNKLPENIGFTEAMTIAGASNKLNIINFNLDLNNRYTIWSGIFGGLFMALAYFGTDQSQVSRYLSGKSIRESQLGLIFNGLLKVPMQFFILLTGVMVFVFYQFNQSPVFFNQAVLSKLSQTKGKDTLENLQRDYQSIHDQKTKILSSWSEDSKKEWTQKLTEEKTVRTQVQTLVKNHLPNSESNDKDYVFINFILTHLPKGVIGLLLAMIFAAAMSSTASEINALAGTTTIDIYKRNINKNGSDIHYVKATQWLTLVWGLIAIGFASICQLFENLIQFVNIVGSIFYGTILGVFLMGFFTKNVKGDAIFWAAIISELLIIAIFLLSGIGFLWLCVIGVINVVLLSMIFQSTIFKNNLQLSNGK